MTYPRHGRALVLYRLGEAQRFRRMGPAFYHMARMNLLAVREARRREGTSAEWRF